MDIRKYSKTYNEVTRSLLEYFAKEKKDENIIISPLSIIMLMGIAADAVQGKAREEILSAIGKEMSYEDLLDVLKAFQANASNSKSLMSANAVCVKDIISDSISPEYPKHLKEVFDGRLFVSDDVARDVNAWVKEKTKGMIENVADESMNQVLACLMNAIAFESEWLEQYEEDDIWYDDFENADGTIAEVQMMSSTENTYIEDELFTGFVKPYSDSKYAFMALLPKQNSHPFRKNAVSSVDFSKLYSEATSEEVHVRIPEFKCDFGEKLNDICSEMGINTLFTTDADFSPMSGEQLMVDSIIHKAHIDVDRKGTKAAAVTMAFVLGALPDFDEKTVELNRPFVYAIMDTETKLPVFTGIYNCADEKQK